MCVWNIIEQSEGGNSEQKSERNIRIRCDQFVYPRAGNAAARGASRVITSPPSDSAAGEEAAAGHDRPTQGERRGGGEVKCGRRKDEKEKCWGTNRTF